MLTLGQNISLEFIQQQQNYPGRSQVGSRYTYGNRRNHPHKPVWYHGISE